MNHHHFPGVEGWGVGLSLRLSAATLWSSAEQFITLRGCPDCGGYVLRFPVVRVVMVYSDRLLLAFSVLLFDLVLEGWRRGGGSYASAS
jgi:hypothetical protein